MLSSRASFVLLATIVIAFMTGSSAPTPLYPVYQVAWGFSPITTTVIFATYALAVLASLLTFGKLSDYLGRKPVWLVTTGFQVLTMLLYASADGVRALIVARLVQGISTGAASAALGAGLIDFDRVRGTTANSVAPMTGTALGGLLSGAVVGYLPWPTSLIYLGLAAVFVVQWIALWFVPETTPRRPGALASLRPTLKLPVEVRRAFLIAMPLLVAAWSLPGFYGALGPSLVRKLVGSTSILLGGVGIFALAGSASITVLVLYGLDARRMMLASAGALVVGLATTLVAVKLASVALFFAGTVIAGGGFGTGFQGAVRAVVPLAPVEHRAGVLSVILLTGYLGMGLPTIAAGMRVVHGGGVTRTAEEYAIATIAFAVLALAGTLLHRPGAGA